MVLLETPTPEDEREIHSMIKNHYRYTRSSVARKILGHFQAEIREFVKVFPIEYKQIVEGGRTREKLELLEVSDG
jgi:glutamate synthase (NADPH/NADH) large chain